MGLNPQSKCQSPRRRGVKRGRGWFGGRKDELASVGGQRGLGMVWGVGWRCEGVAWINVFGNNEQQHTKKQCNDCMHQCKGTHPPTQSASGSGAAAMCAPGSPSQAKWSDCLQNFMGENAAFVYLVMSAVLRCFYFVLFVSQFVIKWASWLSTWTVSPSKNVFFQQKKDIDKKRQLGVGFYSLTGSWPMCMCNIVEPKIFQACINVKKMHHITTSSHTAMIQTPLFKHGSMLFKHSANLEPTIYY